MIGSTISHYKILEKLGEGGMGVVYKAHDTKLKRTVALKFLPRDLCASEENKQRLIDEAQAASALNHPNISHIYEIGGDDCEMFIAMEFIDGSSLRNTIDTGRLKLADAIKIATQIAEGLKAAHKYGVIHRDIKPENVIITEDGIAKIADFGTAKRMGRAVDSDANTISGTIAYMSPEQLQGQQVDHSTDIWSLGVVLYEMVTGQRPFIGEYEQAVMYSILNEKPHQVADLRKDVPVALVNIINRCLEKIPVVRYPNAATLLDELRSIKHELKNPRATAMKSIAVLPFADLSPEKDNEYFSDWLTEEIIANLSKLRLMRVVSRTTLMQYDRKEKTTKQIADDLSVQYLLQGSVRKHGSDLRITTQLIDASQDVYIWAEKYKGTMDDVFDIQETVAGRIAKALKVRLTPGEKKTLKRRSTENTEAYQLYLKGRFFWNKRNKQALETAIRFFEEAIEEDSRYALAWSGLSDSYNLLSEYSSMSRKETYPKAKAAVEKALELDDQLAEARTSLASLMMLDEWDWANAEKEFKLAINLNPNYATAHHWYAEWLLFTGNTEEAVKEISRAADLDPLSPAILKDKGMTLYYARRYDDAMEEGKKTLELDPNFAAAYRLFSLAYQGKKMYPEAISNNHRWGELSGNRAETLTGLAQIYGVSGQKAEALKIIDGLIIEGPTRGNVCRGIALTYAAIGESDLAFTWLEKAFEIKAESLCSLKVDPKADNIRSDPRFGALVKKIGLDI